MIHDIMYYSLKENGNLELKITKGAWISIFRYCISLFQRTGGPTKLFLNICFFCSYHLLAMNKSKNFL